MTKQINQIKTKTSIALFIAALAIGGLMVWFFASGPASITLVEATPFTNESEVGKIVFDQLAKKIYGRKLLVIGIPPQPERYQAFIQEFIQQLSTQNSNVLVLKEEKWPKLDLPGNVEVADFDINADDIATEVEPLRNAMGTRQVVIYTVSIYSTHLIDGNAIHRLEDALHDKIPSLTVGPLVLKSDFENQNEPACVGSMRDMQGLYNLGCAQIFVSRKTYKTQFPLTEKVFTLTEQAPGDYILQLHLLSKH